MSQFLFLLDSLEVGGIQRQLLSVCKTLIARGDNVEVATFRSEPSGMFALFKDAGARVISLEKRSRVDLRFVARLRDLLSDRDLDLVHAMSPQTSLWAAHLLPFYRPPVFISSVLNTHKLEKPLHRWAQQFVVGDRADTVFVNSFAGARQYRRRVGKKSFPWVLHNGVELIDRSTRDDTRRKLGIEENEIACVCVGRLIPIKGHRSAIEAVASLLEYHDNLKLFIIGDGLLREKLDEVCASSGHQGRIVLLGEVEHPEEVLSAFDVTLLPSLSEGFPNALLEGMSAGHACIATNVGGIPEAITHEKTGLLVPPDNTQELASAIKRLLVDKELRLSLGRRARMVATRRFSMERMTGKTLQKYDTLIRRNGAKISYLTSQFPKLSESFVAREIAEMERRGLISRIVSLKPRTERVAHQEARSLMDMTIHRPWLSPSTIFSSALFSLKHPVRSIAAFATIVRMHTENPRELVKMLGIWPAIVATASDLERRGIVHVHSHWATIPTAAAYALAMLLGGTFSFFAHAHDIYRHPLALPEKLEKAAFVATCTARNRTHLRGLVSANHQSKIRLVRHFLTATPDSSALTPLLEREPHLVSVGSLMPYKGFDILIQAFAEVLKRHPKFTLRIIGGGPEEENLIALAKSLNICDRVVFLGHSPQSKVFEELEKARVFALASRKTESGSEDNLPNVLVEACYHGVPVIATDLGSISELVRDGETGLMVESESVEGVTQAILSLIEDENFAKRIAQAGEKRARRYFDLDKNAAEMERGLELSLAKLKRS